MNPADAWAEGSAAFEIRWPEATCRHRGDPDVRSDDQEFRVAIELVVAEDGAEFARRHWAATLPRS